MIDDQVNPEEVAERKRQREVADQKATDDGMPAEPENKAADVAGIRYKTPRQWVRHARKWLAAGNGFMRP
ncbi:MAG TPA: hypothetical protein VGL08_01825 [Paraburkholderia sp.]